LNRKCVVCGASLAGHRADARHCSNGCRAEAWRMRRLLAGARGRSSTLADRMAAYGRPRRRSRSQSRGMPYRALRVAGQGDSVGRPDENGPAALEQRSGPGTERLGFDAGSA
jgi:hypothetical protein